MSQKQLIFALIIAPSRAVYKFDNINQIRLNKGQRSLQMQWADLSAIQ